MSTKHSKKKRKFRNQKYKSHNSFDAINSAFNKTPKWRQKEITAKKRIQKKRQKLIDSVKCIGDDNNDNGNGFNENAFDALFDDTNDNTNGNKNTNFNDNKNNTNISNKPIKKNTHKRKRSNNKKRRIRLNDSSDSRGKKRKLNEYKDSDFEDKGIIIKTIHSTKDNTNIINEIKKKDEMNQKKQAILSQIHRFEICQLLVENIPIEYNEKKLNNYLSSICSIECNDIHLFHNIRDKTKYGKAILIFDSPNICAIGYKYLFGKSLINNKILFIKPISNKYTNYNLKTFDCKNNKINKKNKNKMNNKCKVIKMSNLHWKTSENDIIKFFKPIGIPLTINIEITQNGYTNGIAKVEFKHYKFVYNAINKLNNNKLLNRNILLEAAVTKQLFNISGKEFKNKTIQIAIFNISAQINENDLREFIINTIGKEYEPIDIHLIQHLEIFTTGYAFCKFKTFDITNIIVEKLNNKILCDRPLRVVWSKPSKKYKLKKDLIGKTNVLLFTNLRYDVSEMDIKIFIKSKFDFNVNKVDIFQNAKGFRYGMAKIWVEQCKYADMIVQQLNGKLLKDKVVNINYWVDKNNNNNNKTNNNKGRKGNKNNNDKLGWDDDWFKKNLDGDVSDKDDEAKIKVPQRLLDQIL